MPARKKPLKKKESEEKKKEESATEDQPQERTLSREELEALRAKLQQKYH